MDWLFEEYGELDNEWDGSRRGGYERIAAFIDECETDDKSRVFTPWSPDDKDSAGIYLVTIPLFNGRYVGQSVKIAQRWNSHKTEIQRMARGRWTESPLALFAAQRGITIDSFRFFILEEIDYDLPSSKWKAWLFEKEKFWSVKCKQNIGKRYGKGKGRKVNTNPAIWRP